MIRQYRWLIVVLLVSGTFSYLVISRYLRDVETLTKFSNSYTQFDNDISDLETLLFTSDLSGIQIHDSLERKASRSYSVLKMYSSERISSLIKNDTEFTKLELEITELSGKEIEGINAFRRAVTDPAGSIETLTKELSELKAKRREAYSRFQRLVESAKK